MFFFSISPFPLRLLPRKKINKCKAIQGLFTATPRPPLSLNFSFPIKVLSYLLCVLENYHDDMCEAGNKKEKSM